MASSSLSDSELLQPKQIGTFIRYAMANGHNLVYNENVQIMIDNLRKLLKLGKIDLLLLTRIFMLNDFQNLALEERFDIDNEYFELDDIRECSKRFINPHKNHISTNQRDVLYRPQKELYLKPSPCLNISNHTDCQGYCKWTEDVLNNWTTGQMIDTLKYR